MRSLRMIQGKQKYTFKSAVNAISTNTLTCFYLNGMQKYKIELEKSKRHKHTQTHTRQTKMNRQIMLLMVTMKKKKKYLVGKKTVVNTFSRLKCSHTYIYTYIHRTNLFYMDV